MKNAFKCPITTKLAFVHLFSFPLRKHLERFPSFASTFASLSLEMRTRTSNTHHSLVFTTFQISKIVLSCFCSLSSLVVEVCVVLYDRY